MSKLEARVNRIVGNLSFALYLAVARSVLKPPPLERVCGWRSGATRSDIERALLRRGALRWRPWVRMGIMSEFFTTAVGPWVERGNVPQARSPWSSDREGAR